MMTKRSDNCRMCGIVGYQFIDGERPADRLLHQRFLEQLLLLSKVRGLHATGFVFLEDGRFCVRKAPVPADKFIQQREWECLMSDMPFQAMFHTRYCTSGDWQENLNNQPLVLGKAALVHNGVVSMATKEEFQEAYRVRTTTSNDSEIILRLIKAFMNAGETAQDAIDHALQRISNVEPPIFACGVLTSEGELLCCRDHVRPLYRFWVPELNMVGFCSTKDIFNRAICKSGLDRAKAKLFACAPYMVYSLTSGTKHEISIPSPGEQRLCPCRPVSFGVDKRFLQNDRITRDPRLDSPANTAIDFRRERREGFIHYYAGQVLTDIDPAFPTLKEIFERYELSIEQKFWAAFLYAVFYENATLFLVMQEFPELEKVDLGRLQRWHDKNWKLLQYQTDRRWNKGHFVEMVKSYRDLVGNQTQHQFFSTLMAPQDPTTSFNNCWTELHKVFKMGRHSVYAWTETLMRCLGLPIRCPSFYMDIAESSRNGLCYALDRDDLVTKDDKKLSDGVRISKAEIAHLEAELDRLMADIRERYPSIPVDYMYLETATCSYKGLHRRRRYLGYYLDRMAMEIKRGETKMAAISNGVDWDTLWQIRSEIFLPDYLGVRQTLAWFDIRHELCEVFLDTGQLINLSLLQKRGLINIAAGISTEEHTSLTAGPGHNLTENDRPER